MKYLKTFEKYSFFDTQKFYGKTLFRGMSEGELDAFKSKEILGYFFSESKSFAEDYGDYILEFKLNTDRVFNSHDPRNIKKLYDMGNSLTDKYEDREYLTYEDYIENGGDSDTWDVIEHSDVLPWIMSEYDACLISEGGESNYYIENPSILELLKIHNNI